MSLHNPISIMRRHKHIVGAVAVGSVGLVAVFSLSSSQAALPFSDPLATSSEVSASLAGSAIASAQESVAESPNNSNSTSSTSTSTTSNVSSSTKPKVSVTVNGKSVSVPKDGNLHKVVEDNDSRTVIDVHTSQNGSSASHSTTVQNITTSHSGAGGTSVTTHSSN
jgi:hypothetical protein